MELRSEASTLRYEGSVQCSVYLRRVRSERKAAEALKLPVAEAPKPPVSLKSLSLISWFLKSVMIRGARLWGWGFGAFPAML